MVGSLSRMPLTFGGEPALGMSVRCATTASVTIATALNSGDTIDGVVVANGDLVLVKDQAAPAGNGVYLCGATPVRWRAFDAYRDHPGRIISVEEGTTNADTIWQCTSNRGGTLGTTAIAFTRLLVSAEDISDTVGAMVSGNTETHIAVTYQDSDNTIDFAVNEASTAQMGVVELATSAETITGTDTARAVTPAGAAAAFQPLDSDLTAIAALTTTSFGRALLELANAAALRTAAEIEFGTFTPTMAFATPGTSSFSYTTQLGNYAKVGTFYIFFARLNVTPTIGTGSGDVRLGGLPATVGSRRGTGWVSLMSSTISWPASRTMATCFPEASTAYALLNGLGSATGNSLLQASNLTGGSGNEVYYGGVYST